MFYVDVIKLFALAMDAVRRDSDSEDMTVSFEEEYKVSVYPDGLYNDSRYWRRDLYGTYVRFRPHLVKKYIEAGNVTFIFGVQDLIKELKNSDVAIVSSTVDTVNDIRTVTIEAAGDTVKMYCSPANNPFVGAVARLNLLTRAVLDNGIISCENSGLYYKNGWCFKEKENNCMFVNGTHVSDVQLVCGAPRARTLQPYELSADVILKLISAHCWNDNRNSICKVDGLGTICITDDSLWNSGGIPMSPEDFTALNPRAAYHIIEQFSKEHDMCIEFSPSLRLVIGSDVCTELIDIFLGKNGLELRKAIGSECDVVRIEIRSSRTIRIVNGVYTSKDTSNWSKILGRPDAVAMIHEACNSIDSTLYERLSTKIGDLL